MVGYVPDRIRSLPDDGLTFRPRLIIDRQTQFCLEELAAPYLGKKNRKPLCNRIRNLLADIDSKLDILITDFTAPEDRKARRIQLGVTVNGIPDHGLIFGQREPVVTN